MLIILFFIVLTIFLIFPTETMYAQPTQNFLMVNDTNLRVQANKTSPIKLTATTTNDLAKVPLIFSIVQNTTHGKLNPLKPQIVKADGNSRSVSIKYNITKNYIGPDSFTFRISPIDASNVNSTGIVYLEVVPPILVPNIIKSVEKNK